jgi:hypothetical protein
MTHKTGLSLSQWILLVLVLAALGAPERASGEARSGSTVNIAQRA